jgi:BirA family biotin operon repressor/biotin-[acetyl-CoA-carboxylase] ligase
LGGALRQVLPPATPLAFKWPNDVLVGGRKVSGILLEASGLTGERLDSLVVGVGVNVAASPADVAYAATSLAESGAGEVSVADLLAGFATAFLAELELWRREGFAPARRRWLAHAEGLGGPVEVRLDRETLAGRFAALDESGGLALDLPSGQRRIVSAGDVFFPRP